MALFFNAIYIYLCYGLHYILNIVCSEINNLQAVLIRALVEAEGPAKAIKFLNINNLLNGESIINNSKISMLDDGKDYSFVSDKSVEIDYALEKDENALLRFILN